MVRWDLEFADMYDKAERLECELVEARNLLTEIAAKLERFTDPDIVLGGDLWDRIRQYTKEDA